MALSSWLVRPDESKSQNKSNASSDISEIFLGNRSESESNSNPELNSKDLDDDDDDDPSDNPFNDEGQLPPEYYLAKAESLDVSQLFILGLKVLCRGGSH